MKCYIVDAFADQVFKGNPAAICICDYWLEDDFMKKIAMENNLSETAFIVPKENVYELRWFTPGGEIDLCGHATLASAFVLMNYIDLNTTTITFETKSGILIVHRKEDLYEMDLPAYTLTPVPVTKQMEEAIGQLPKEAWLGRDLVCVMEKEDDVIQTKCDFDKIKKLDGMLLHITAPGHQYDCVTRSFAPKLNVLEDPVCGSGHCHVIPLWAEKLKKETLSAFQASQRSGILYCQIDHDRVKIAGKVTLYAISTLYI